MFLEAIAIANEVQRRLSGDETGEEDEGGWDAREKR
jgi:hypothetical protein